MGFVLADGNTATTMTNYQSMYGAATHDVGFIYAKAPNAYSNEPSIDLDYLVIEEFETGYTCIYLSDVSIEMKYVNISNIQSSNGFLSCERSNSTDKLNHTIDIRRTKCERITNTICKLSNITNYDCVQQLNNEFKSNNGTILEINHLDACNNSNINGIGSSPRIRFLASTITDHGNCVDSQAACKVLPSFGEKCTRTDFDNRLSCGMKLILIHSCYLLIAITVNL